MPIRSASFIACLLAAATPLPAQELTIQATPFSVWIDFDKLNPLAARKLALPIWIESVAKGRTAARGRVAEISSFRIRFRRIGNLNGPVQLRLFFFDDPNASPIVKGWTETGVLAFSSGPLGLGLDLPSSALLVVPGAEVDYLDIEVPGDGSNVRGAFLSSLQKHQTQRAVDFPSAAAIEDPFGNFPPLKSPADDTFLFGRVRATVDPGIVKLAHPAAPRAEYDFELENSPALVLCTFEILNADPVRALRMWVNDRPLGSVSPHFPDLADPGYQVRTAPAGTESQVHYTGWLRVQVPIRGAHLSAGLNKIVFGLDEGSEPVAIRAMELQLKQKSLPE